MKKHLSFILLSYLFITTIGAIWDIWSHSMSLVETFWTPSHAMIYFSVAGAGFTVLGVVIYECKKIGSFSPIHIPNAKGLALAGSGSVFQLIAGASDDLYHSIFGFDVTMWSPPHIAVIYGAVLTLLGIFELRNPSNEIRSFFSSLLALSMVIVIYQFSTLEYDMDFSHYKIVPDDYNWDVINRWKPYSAYLSILLIPIFSYCFTIGTKKFKFAIGTIVSSFAFLIKYLIFIWYNSTPLDMHFPLLIPLCGICFDLIHIYMKKTEKSYYYGNLAAGILLVFLVEIENPLPIDWTKLPISLIGVIVLSLLFTRFSLKSLSLKGYHVLWGMILVSFIFPLHVWAHDKKVIIVPPEEKVAPDLHPLFVLLEFSIIFYLGYRLAHYLSTINRKKD